MSRLSTQCWILHTSQPYRPPRPITGIALLRFFLTYALAFLVVSFPSGFPTNILHAILVAAMHTTCPAYLILLDVIILTIPGEEYKL
jgi:hypothetical protein